MSCFASPLAAAAVAGLIRRHVKFESKSLIPFSTKLAWLEKMFLGGSALLAFEHVWHGEIIATAPFFTAGISETLREIAVTGSVMTLSIVAVWLGMCAVAEKIARRAVRAAAE